MTEELNTTDTPTEAVAAPVDATAPPSNKRWYVVHA